MITRIWHGATPATKSDEYLSLMRTVAIPDYRSTPSNKGAYALRRIEGDAAHFLMVVLGIRGGDPRLRRRRHQLGEILRLRQGFPARTGAVLHTLRDVRPVSPHAEFWVLAENLRLTTAPTTKSTHRQCRKLIANGKPSASSTARYSAPMMAPSRQKSLVGM